MDTLTTDTLNFMDNSIPSEPSLVTLKVFIDGSLLVDTSLVSISIYEGTNGYVKIPNNSIPYNGSYQVTISDLHISGYKVDSIQVVPVTGTLTDIVPIEYAPTDVIQIGIPTGDIIAYQLVVYTSSVVVNTSPPSNTVPFSINTSNATALFDDVIGFIKVNGFTIDSLYKFIKGDSYNVSVVSPIKFQDTAVSIHTVSRETITYSSISALIAIPEDATEVVFNIDVTDIVKNITVNVLNFNEFNLDLTDITVSQRRRDISIEHTIGSNISTILGDTILLTLKDTNFLVDSITLRGTQFIYPNPFTITTTLSSSNDIDVVLRAVLVDDTPPPEPEVPPPTPVVPVTAFDVSEYVTEIHRDVINPYLFTFSNTGNTPITSVRIDINNTVYDTFDVTNSDITVPIYQSMFPGTGTYLLTFYPISDTTIGNGVPITVTVVYTRRIPIITSVEYDSILTGRDYYEYDERFTVKWESNQYTSHVLLFSKTGKQLTKLPSNGLYALPLSDILEAYEYTYENSIIDLTLIPFDFDEIEGAPISIQFEFVIGKVLTKEDAISHIVNGFLERLKQAAHATFSDKVSRYATHVANINNDSEFLVTNWSPDIRGTVINPLSDTLILKLYEPVPDTVSLTSFVTISKIVSQPIVEIISLRSDFTNEYVDLRGPNFNINTFSESIGSDISTLLTSNELTSDRILSEYLSQNGIDTKKLDIKYSDNTEVLWNNFTHFSSAVDRVNVFMYKVGLIQSLRTQKDTILSSGVSLDYAETINANIVKAVGSFDGFEYHLYYSDSGIAYPKQSGVPVPITDPLAISWYSTILQSATDFDYTNTNYIINHIPAFMHKDELNSEFMLFLGMIASHFDVFWSYIRILSNRKNVAFTKFDNPDIFVYDLLKSFGWDVSNHFASNNIWEYLFGTDGDGNTIYNMSLSDANHEVWRRLLTNLPYILKTKGTKTAIQAVLNCYGIPRDVVSIIEFGHTNAPDKYTVPVETTTSSIILEDANIAIGWKDISLNSQTHKPQTINVRHLVHSSRSIVNLLSTSSFKLQYYKVSNNSYKYLLILGTPDLLIGPNGSYILDGNNDPTRLDSNPSNHIITTDILHLNSDYDTVSLICEMGIPMSTYHLRVYKFDGSMLYVNTSVSYVASASYWNSGGVLNVGPNMYGIIDYVKLYKSVLVSEITELHATYPDSIRGNELDSYKSDLVFYLNFEQISELVNGNTLPNLSISSEYAEPTATVSSIQSAPIYPYQFVVYTHSQNVSFPYNLNTYVDKVRIEDTTLISDLSHARRSTRKSYDDVIVDSPKLGILVSPAYHLNMDIAKTIGYFNIGDYIGNPADEYKSKYTELSELRASYFTDATYAFQYYFNYIKYVNKLLFETLLKLVPVRGKVAYGLLIEPHILERSKSRKHKPLGTFSEGGVVDINIDSNIHLEAIPTLDSDIIVPHSNLTADATDYSVHLIEPSPNIDAESILHLSDIDIDNIKIISSTHTYDSTTISPSPDVIGTDAYIGDMSVSIDLIARGCEASPVTYAGYIDYGVANIYPVEGYSWITKINYDGSPTSNLFLVLKIKLKNIIRKYIDTDIYTYPFTFIDVDEHIELVTLVPVVRNPFYFYDIIDDDGNLITDEFGRILYESILPMSVIDYITSMVQYNGESIFNGCTYIEKNIIQSIELVNSYDKNHHKYTSNYSEGFKRSFYKGSLQTIDTTPDGLPPVEVFATNPNSLKVTESNRGSGQPILKIS